MEKNTEQNLSLRIREKESREIIMEYVQMAQNACFFHRGKLEVKAVREGRSYRKDIKSITLLINILGKIRTMIKG